jgi:hypothetical protein
VNSSKLLFKENDVQFVFGKVLFSIFGLRSWNADVVVSKRTVPHILSSYKKSTAAFGLSRLSRSVLPTTSGYSPSGGW